MADFMQWVANRHFPIALIFTTLLVGIITAISSGSISIEPEVPPTQFCFDQGSASIRVTTLAACPPTLIPLGSGALSESATAQGQVDEIHPILLARFSAAQSVAQLEGVNLYITSGFRSLERQDFLFHREVLIRGSETEAAKWGLPADKSHHPQGLAIDVNYPGDRPGARWLEENGPRFGLCRVYANEWWHFEAVSAPGERCPALAPNALVDLG